MRESYLKDRLQNIKIGKIEYEKKSVKGGAPQGSLFCSMPSIIYLNEVPIQKSKESQNIT